VAWEVAVTVVLAELAAELRTKLDGVLGTLTGRPLHEQQEALKAALGVPALGPDALLLRLMGAGDLAGLLATAPGRAWPLLASMLAHGARQAAWDLDVPGALRMRPDSVEVLAPVLPPVAEVHLDLLSGGPTSGQPGVRVERAGLILTLPSDPAAAAVRLTARLRVDLPGDELLTAIAPRGLTLEGELGARVDDATGIHFDSGGTHGAELALRAVPPALRAPSLSLGISQAPNDTVLLTASFGASLLGLADATVERVGLAVTVTATAAPVVTPVDPAGAGLTLALGPVKGGGHLDRGPDGRYGGALALRLGTVDVHAFCLLRGDPFTLLAVLTAEFTPPIELGLAVTLSGVGGVVGINYAVDTGGLAAAIQNGHLDDLLFPADPAAAAPRILATLTTVFRERPGSVLVGPLFRIGWGRPVSFLTADVGLILELPSGRVNILGRLRVALPAPRAPVLDLRAAVSGLVDPANGLVEIKAALTGSRLLFAPIDGGLALRAKTGADATFILSAGGFHPRFTPPPAFPTPRRLMIPIADSPLLHITFSGYFAVTPATVQAGATLTASIGTDALGVSGRLGFDALVRWEPSFGISLSLYGSFDLHVGGVSLCSVDLRVLVEGPTPCWHVAGRASLSLFLFDVDFPFDEHWGCSGEVTAPPPPAVARLLAGAASDPRSWAAVLPADAGSLATLRGGGQGLLLHPLGRVRFSQRVVPLGVTITRYGPARLPRPAAFEVDVAFASGAGAMVGPTVEQFARADFFELTDDDKLSQPAFEPLRSGAELAPAAPPWLTMPNQAAAVRYETKFIGEHGPEPRPRRSLGEGLVAAALEHGAVGRSGVHLARSRYAAPGAPAVMRPRAYAAAAAATLREDPTIPRATFTEVHAALAARPGATRLLQAVSTWEVRP
jgi:hypothetical protein